MNRGTIVRLAVLGALAVMLVLRLGGGDRGEASRSAARGAAGTSSGESGASEEQAALIAKPAGDSLLASFRGTFVDATGRSRTLDEFRGAPYVASVLYTRCATVCPRVVAALKRFDRELGHAPSPRFVLFSLDPAHDTPDVLRAFAATHGLEPGRWTLLAPNAESLPDLADALGVASQPDAEGGIAHSAVVAVVGANGIVRARRVGLDLPPSALMALWRAANEPD